MQYHKIIIFIFVLLIFIIDILYIQYKSKKRVEFEILLNKIYSNQTTVISTYFKINKSKHNDLEYQKWIKNFLLSVKSPLVIFTDNQSISKQLLNLRKNLPTKLYIYSSHWAILKEIEQKRNKNYTLNYKYVQNKLDPEQPFHSSDLYVLWNIKSYITNKIAQENPFNSTMFIYTDSGAWRDRPLLKWPNELFIKNVSNLIQNKILFGQVSDLNIQNSSSIIDINLVAIIEGTFFMGSKIAISNFETHFWQIHDQLFDQGLFVGKVQTIMNIFAFKSNKSHLIARLKANNTNCIRQVNIWFFYQYFLASNKYYTCNDRKENLII
jgi:hypothetical protein